MKLPKKKLALVLVLLLFGTVINVVLAGGVVGEGCTLVDTSSGVTVCTCSDDDCGGDECKACVCCTNGMTQVVFCGCVDYNPCSASGS